MQVGWKINEGSSLVRNVSQIIEDADTVSAFAIFAVLVPSFLRGPVMWLARTIPGTVDYVREKSMRIVLAESQKIIEQRRKVRGRSKKQRQCAALGLFCYANINFRMCCIGDQVS